MPDCIFCKIIKNEFSSKTLFEDDRIKVFEDARPKAPVHFLIVPKKHIESLITLAPEDGDVAQDLLFGAQRAARHLKLEGYKVILNVGRKGGQIVDHIHLHLLANWEKPESLDI